ncbi:ATPase AAA [Pseudoalteromonas sp. A25]|uniref:AAA family ATPase n=1 Tax=Pseudoalteromonas sp. A25 TaxID=116092 RepID=UPI0012605B93|nr:AAA family ATPase [Pseudoalteromonas sp. A25]BBN81645.1 ATPase AAA [Pseudoalteromonas sp. A25]
MSLQINNITSQLAHVIYGKEQQIKLAVCCLLCRGHLLIEDLPGMGKTTLSHGLADVLGLSYQRVQFTSDLLPGDVLGSAIFNSVEHQFHFHPGPIFSQVLLADEINRASPKTQSALLEAMEERQVTVDGVSHPLPEPFFVIATQNPLHQAGTHPLPESQLDRFLMRISLGYPSEDAEKKLILGIKQQSVSHIQQVVDSDALKELQAHINDVKVAEVVVEYILALVRYTRECGKFTDPLSPRASIALGNAVKAWALMDGRDYATQDDVQAVFGSIAAHRLNIPCHLQEKVVSDILSEVEIPL